jgi:flavin reductase (DIM6/NTAB) family NADH-FMN oxidoreductase RutF
MKLDPAAMSVRDVYGLMIGLITPRPIAWVSTVSSAGIVNLAPFSFFAGVSANPPTVAISVVNRRDGSRKDTAVNVEATGELVVNAVPYALREEMNTTSAEVAPDVDELALAGLTPVPSETVRPPRVGESPAQLECVLHQLVRVGDGPLAANLIIARIQRIHVSDAILGPEGQPDPRRLDTIGRLGGDGYARTTDRFAMPRPPGAR